MKQAPIRWAQFTNDGEWHGWRDGRRGEGSGGRRAESRPPRSSLSSATCHWRDRLRRRALVAARGALPGTADAGRCPGVGGEADHRANAAVASAATGRGRGADHAAAASGSPGVGGAAPSRGHDVSVAAPGGGAAGHGGANAATAAGTTSGPPPVRGRPTPASPAAPPATHSAAAGEVPHIATNGRGETVRPHVPPTPAAEAAADDDDGRKWAVAAGDISCQGPRVPVAADSCSGGRGCAGCGGLASGRGDRVPAGRGGGHEWERDEAWPLRLRAAGVGTG